MAVGTAVASATASASSALMQHLVGRAISDGRCQMMRTIFVGAGSA